MKTRMFAAMTLMAVLTATAGSARAQAAPQLINYQGRIADNSGLPPTDGATLDLTFIFYGAETGPAPLYLSVLQQNVVVSGGLYHVLIGSGTITPGVETSLAAVFQKNPDVWLAVKIDDDPEMSPRARVTSVPYALASASAASCSTVDPSFLGAFLGNPDWDGDGGLKTTLSGNSVDCNDGNSAIYAGASERCDGLDNQCPGDPGYGTVDENCDCVDHDLDGRGENCAPGLDCDDEDPDNWNACAACEDLDLDSYYVGCDAYLVRSGPDCDDLDPNNQLSCSTCLDIDLDESYDGCDAYLTIDGPDCDDLDENNWDSCATCLDGDDDDWWAGCDAYISIDGPECNDGDSTIHPGAPETACDLIDQDCNGSDLCGPVYAWTRRIGSTGMDRGFDVAADGAGNLFLAGDFSVTVDFGADFGSSESKTSLGAADTFITRATAAGGYGWTKRLGGTGSEIPQKIVADGSGNLYILGKFSGTNANFAADFGGTDLKTATSWDIYVTRINADLTYGWTRRIGGAGAEYPYGLALDGNGDVYITGSFDAAVNFMADFGGTDAKAPTNTDLFVMKILANGAYGWTRKIGGTSNDYEGGLAVFDGNIYLTGLYQSTTNFAADFGSTDSRTAGGCSDIFVTKISTAAAYAWTRVFTGVGCDSGKDIAVDAAGNVFVTGYFEQTIDFAADWSGSDSKTSAGAADAFVTKINANGTYGWTKRMGGIGAENANAVALDGSGNLYLVGVFNNVVNFGADWSQTLCKTPAGSNDVFVARVLAAGGLDWVKRLGGIDYDVGYGVAVDGANSVYVTGMFGSAVNFAADWGGSDSKTSLGNYEAFFTKIEQP